MGTGPVEFNAVPPGPSKGSSLSVGRSTMASAAARTAGKIGARAVARGPRMTAANRLERSREIVVDDDVVELGPVRHVAQRILEPSLDHGLGVRLAPAQPPLELARRSAAE